MRQGDLHPGQIAGSSKGSESQLARLLVSDSLPVLLFTPGAQGNRAVAVSCGKTDAGRRMRVYTSCTMNSVTKWQGVKSEELKPR